MHAALISTLLQQRQHFLNSFTTIAVQQIVKRIEPFVQLFRIERGGRICYVGHKVLGSGENRDWCDFGRCRQRGPAGASHDSVATCATNERLVFRRRSERNWQKLL